MSISDSKNIQVFGRVQGVAFRYYAKLKADELSLKGFVQNELDGSVYIEIEGPVDNVSKFITWCQIGSPASHVEKIELSDKPLSGFSCFNIKR